MSIRHTITAEIIKSNKDFDSEWIKEMIVSRILIADIPAMIADLEPHRSSNDPNGAGYAIRLLEKFWGQYGN